MPPRQSSKDQPQAPSPRRRSRSASTSPDAAAEEPLDTAAAAPLDAPEEEDIAAHLSFRDAQTALELSLAELQSPDLDVEDMAGLYRRASRYADRCEQLLQQVEQQVMQWDPGQPLEPPIPYQP